MANPTSSANSTVVIHTGNILTIREVKMKAGQNTTEELIESLRYVIRNCSQVSDESGQNRWEANTDHQALNLDSQEMRKDVKVSVKLFVRQYEGELIRTALLAGFNSLNTPIIESVVLALQGDNPLPFQTIQDAWKVLEEFILEKKVVSIGVSDIDTDVFISLYEWAKVKPGIVQINLAHCCVVQPLLQGFTREHEVQLLTHSDPIDILPDDVLAASFAEDDLPLAKCMANHSLLWATRYQVHIKCRGVLSSKGYIISLKK